MKKKIYGCISLILFGAILVTCVKGCNYILVNDTNSYTRTMMHQLYDPEENIDILFVGSSHVYRSIDPAITDEEFGCYTFDGSSSSQRMDGSLAIIKEAATYNNLKHIYLEVYYDLI